MEEKRVNHLVLLDACAWSGELVQSRLEQWLLTDLSQLVLQFLGQASFP